MLGVKDRAQAGSRISAGKVSDFELDKFRIFDTPIGSVGVAKTDNGFVAFRNRCPHQGAPICVGSKLARTTLAEKPFEYDLDPSGPVVRCPWHRWEFHVESGESVGNITRGRLAKFPVEVEGDDVFVALPNRPNTARVG